MHSFQGLIIKMSRNIITKPPAGKMAWRFCFLEVGFGWKIC
ncbi:hypothetical protein D1AOALGA4SA_4837 [Olavius algarvensis Delta 1 endosymbiont]|nr:hypothetical protein D1AOALGA4SA_4837 [Olavius algarvensis Delta 1 endosymbiont]